MSSQMRGHALLVIFGILFAAYVPAAWAQKPLAIYVLDFDTNIAGENRVVAVNLATSIETAFSHRRTDFKVLERRTLQEIVRQNKLERDLNALSKGNRPSSQFIKQLSQADGVLRGELKEDHLGGVVLTLSLTKLDSEKLWQSQKIHTLYEWLNGDLRTTDAVELAADAAASINVPSKSASHIAADDAARGIELVEQGHCREAMPFLQNASAADSKNTEMFYRMGRCQNQAGEYEAAVESLKSAIETNAGRADLFVERAISFSALKDFPTALRDLDQALKLDPGNLAAVELRGDVFMQRGHYNDAVGAYYEVYQQRPTHARCVKLAAAYRKNGASNASLMLERDCGLLP
jgi:tetratricopeptide (TPR) repeat protein